MDDVFSEAAIIDSGVPQGSMYVMYVSCMPNNYEKVAFIFTLMISVFPGQRSPGN